MNSLPRRIGLLVPASDPVVEADFHAFLPPGLSFHTARLHQSAGSKAASIATLEELADAAEPAARSVALVEPELIVFACTSASLFRGYGWDRELAGKISAATGIPATTTSTAVVEAHRALGLTEVVMITPYPEETNRREVEFLGAHGIRVLAYASFGCERSRDIGFVAPDAIRDRVLADRERILACGGAFVSCTALRVLGLVDELEATLGATLVTSNQATLWAVLRRLGIDSRGVPGGRLMGCTGVPSAVERDAV